MPDAKPVGGKILTPSVLFLTGIFVLGAYFLVMRYIHGIGYVTNLNDFQSWGLWKVLGVLIGAAFVNGGFITAFFVYILNKGKYHRFVRQAVLFSLLGYSFAAFSLVYDTGRYINLLNFFIPKYMQPNSVLFEVGVCVTAYILILGIEFLPAVMERFLSKSTSRNLANHIHDILNKMLFLTVAFGVVLPTMHQSGLGGLALLFGDKLSPLWQTPFISLFFVISSVFMGFSVVTAVECVLADRFTASYIKLLSTMMRVAAYIAILYAGLRWWAVYRNDAIKLATVFNIESVFFWIEWVFLLLGLLFVRGKRSRRKPRNLFLGAAFLISGGLLYRFNTYIIGYQSIPGQTYFPSLPEFLVSAGLISLQLILFSVFIKIFPILEKD